MHAGRVILSGPAETWGIEPGSAAGMRLGLGLAALGRPAYITLGHGADLAGRTAPGALRDHAWRVLDAALDGGVHYFDAARSYGRAEEFLGGWLRSRALSPGRIAVGSKWGYTYTAGWRVDVEVHEVKDHSAATLDRQWPQSEAHLGPWLRLYQIHSATLASGVLARADVLRRLADLRMRHGVAIGLSLSGPEQALTLGRALRIEIDGRRLFDAVQATWNPLEPSAAAALSEAHAAGLTVIVKEAMANGRLSAAAGPLATLATGLGATTDAVALAAALARPWADIVLSGASTVAQLTSNLRAPAVVWTDAAEAALPALAESPSAYWQRRASLPWT